MYVRNRQNQHTEKWQNRNFCMYINSACVIYQSYVMTCFLSPQISCLIVRKSKSKKSLFRVDKNITITLVTINHYYIDINRCKQNKVQWTLHMEMILTNETFMNSLYANIYCFISLCPDVCVILDNQSNLWGTFLCNILLSVSHTDNLRYE
jgi:hypothetical protein